MVFRLIIRSAIDGSVLDDTSEDLYTSEDRIVVHAVTDSNMFWLVPVFTSWCWPSAFEPQSRTFYTTRSRFTTTFLSVTAGEASHTTSSLHLPIA